MKVAFISHTSNLGGAEKMLVNLTKLLGEKSDLEVHVYAYGNGKLTREFLVQPKVEYHSLQNPLPFYICIQDDRDHIMNYWAATVQVSQELTASFREVGIECVVINTLTSLAGIVAASTLHLPSVVWVHGILDHFTLPEAGGNFKMACDRLLLAASTRVVCPSDWVRQHYQHYRSDIEIISNFTSVPDQPASYPEGEAKFVCFNSWQPLKGIGCLLDAARILRDEEERFELHLYGSGPSEPEIKEKIKKYHLQDRVIMHDKVEDISAAYAEMHVLVTASHFESFGMTLIEAMAHARPVIASDTSGHQEIMNKHGGGWKAEVEKPEDFARLMRQVIRDPQDAKSVGERGYETARSQYDGRVSADAFYSALSEIATAETEIPDDKKMNRYLNVDVLSQTLDSLLGGSRQVISAESQAYVKATTQTIVGQPDVAVRVGQKIRYRVNVSDSLIATLSIMIGTHGQRISGTIRMLIRTTGGKLLRETALRVEAPLDNEWISFEFNPIHNLKGQILDIVFVLNTNHPLSIYESANPSGLERKADKILRKIGIYTTRRRLFYKITQ